MADVSTKLLDIYSTVLETDSATVNSSLSEKKGLVWMVTSRISPQKKVFYILKQ